MTEVLQYTVDEQICACISKQVNDGDVWAQGINTPLVSAGLILGKIRYAPRARFTSAIGQALVQDWGPLGIADIESLWVGKGLIHLGFAAGAADILPKYRPKEFFRPAQVDSRGNFNNIAFGKDYQRPRMRLPGSSGMGHAPQRKQGGGPRYLVSDLGQFDWREGRMRLTSLHAHADIEKVKRKTGFDLQIAPHLCRTPPPDAEDLRLLREEIDPLATRKLETLGGAARKDLLRAILRQEGAL